MNSEIRVGQGWDRHRLIRGGNFKLGGVKISGDYSVEAHSDGDVALHALVDALLGAAGLNDIGFHFPPSSERWAGADSAQLLEETIRKIQSEGWSVGNVDLTVIMQAIKLSKYREKMEKVISKLLPGGPPVNVKFKTAEDTGPVGRNEAVDAQALVLLIRSN